MELEDSDATIFVETPMDWQMNLPKYAVNSTAALFEALSTIRNSSRGGDIELARGFYKFTTETIDLPPFTVLRGESTALGISCFEFCIG